MADFIMRNVPGYVPGRGSTPGGPAAAGGRATASSRATHDPTAKKPEAPPPEVVNSSTDAPVFRGDGIQLFGLDAELELKARAKRDPNIERYIEEWIEALTGEQLAPKGDLSESLKNGVMMCKLVNVIHPGIVKAINMRPIALMEMENIGFYLKACWTLGVPSGELFVTSDLYLKKGIPAVLANLISLARVAQAKESLKDKPVLACLPPLKVADPNAPVSERPARPMLQKSATDSKLASRWNKVAAGEKPEAAAPAADSLEADPEYVSSGLMADQLNALKKRLEKELAEKAELKKAKQTLEEQLMKLQKPVDAAEEDSKKEAETRKALATAEFAALQQELSTLRDKNARKSIMLKDSVSRQEQMQRQLEEKNRLEEEVKRLRSMEEDLKQAKAKGEVAETLEREVKDLREKNYRKSIMLRETVATQQQLQQQLGAQAGLEEEVKRLRSLEGEVERLRMQGKDSAAHEAEVKQLREELKEKYLLEQELKKLRGLEGQMQQMKAAGQDTAGIEMMAKQVRDVSNRRSILIQQKHATATIGSTAKGARSNTAASPLTPVARPAPAAAQAKDDLSWLKASDEHLARSQADVDEEAKRIKQLTAQIEQLKSERRESAAQQIVTELGQLNARHQRKVRIHQKALQDRQEYDNGRQALESIEREISRARAEGGVVAEMEAEFKQLKEANDKKGALIRENLQRIAQLEGMAADKLPAPPSALPPPVPTLGVTPPSGPTPGASPRKDVAKARSTTASMAVLPSDDARTGRSATSAGSSQVTSELEQQIKQLREQNARKSVALKDAAQVQKMLDMHMKEKESLEKEVTRMKNMEAEVKKLRRQGKETEQLEKEMNSLKAVNDKKNEELKRAEAALEKEVSEKADLEAEVQRLKSLEDELVRLRAEDAKSKSAYESELNQLRANASRKSMMLKDAMKQQQTMQTQLADRAALEAEVVSLRQLHGQIEVTKQQYEAQMREAAALQEQLKRQMEEKTALQAEVKKMKALERELNDLRSAGKDAQAMEDEIKQLRAAGAQAKSAKDSVALQAELNVLREKERANSSQMKQLQSKLAELEEEKSNLEAELASQLETNATQIDQLLQMESDLREAREKAAEAEVLQEEVALLKLELETAAESGASASAPDVDISKFESKIASLTEELLKLKEAEIKTEKLEKHISELEGEVIHLRVSAKDAEALEREVELLRQQTAELQAAQLTNPYEGEMHAMEEEMNKMRKVKEEDDRELFDLRLKVKMQEEQLKKAAAARPVPVPGAVEGTSPTAGGGADPALQAKLQQLQEALMKEKMEKVSVTKQLIDLKTNMTRARSDSSSAAQTREIQQLRAVIAREQQDKQRYIEMLQQQGLIGAASDSAAKQNKMAALEAVLARVLNSKSVEFSDVAKFNDLFKSDAGRRVFTRMLKKQMKETTSLLLSDNSFDILLFIFNTVLQNQDESKSKDFRSCKIVMYASCALGKRGADGRADFIQYHIQGYDIWRNLGFWEQYFYDEVARKYKEQSPSSAAHTDEAEKLVAKQFTENVIPVLISSFAHDMIITWKVPADKVREFAANMSVVNNLPDRVQEQLKSDVAFYEASLTSPQKRKELEAGLKKKFRASQLFMKTFQSNQLGGPGPAAPAAGGHAPVKQPTRPMPVKQLPTPPSGADETRQRHGNTVSGPSAPPAVKPQAAALGSSAGEEEEDEDDSGMMIGKAKKWKRMSMARLASPSAPQPMKR